MKQFIKPILPLLLFGFTAVKAQVGIGTTTPDASAMLEVKSTSQGFLPPRMTSAQRAAIVNPANGLMVFQTDGTRGIYYYDSPQWINMTTGIVPDANGLATSLTTSIVTTFTGTGEGGSDDSYAPNSPSGASFDEPRAMAKDAEGNLYVIDRYSRKIRKINLYGSVSTLATVGDINNSPQCIVLDAAGNCYVTMTSTILKITPAGVVSTFAGNSTKSVIDGSGTGASFRLPLGIAIDATGTLYVADVDCLRKITPTGVVTTLVTASAYLFTTGMVLDAAGNIVVSTEQKKIVKINPTTGAVTEFAGGGSGQVDGLGATAGFSTISGLAIDAEDNLYATDGLSKIRRISASGMVTTLAGNGNGSEGFVNGIGLTAAFYLPYGIAVANDGNLYVADVLNKRIRKIVVLPGTQPK